MKVLIQGKSKGNHGITSCLGGLENSYFKWEQRTDSSGKEVIRGEKLFFKKSKTMDVAQG